MKKNIIKFKDSKKVTCKAFECTDSATTKGFCRLHYLMKLKGSASLFGGEGVEDKKSERRKGNRLDNMESTDHENIERAPEELVQTLTEIEGQTPTTILDVEDLNPFKKTGS